MGTHHLITIVTSSLSRIFPETEPEGAVSRLSCLRNEPLSFQVAYKLDSNQSFCEGIYARIESDLPIALYAVGYLPVLRL